MSKKWNRRDFVRAGILGSGGALAGASAEAVVKPPERSAEPGVRYRTLGRTKLKVSEVGFGSYGFSAFDVFNAALNAGINLVETCDDYQRGKAEESIGKVLAKRRKDAIIATGHTPRADTSKAEFLENLDQSLKRLQTDHIDLYLAHMIGTLEQIRNPALFEAFDEAKKAKKANFLALTSHGPKDIGKVLEYAAGCGKFDALIFKYNFMEFSDADKAIELAAKNNIGVAVFKVEAGARDKELNNYMQGGVAHDQAASRWALKNPAVASVVRPFGTFDDVKAALQTMSKPFGAEEAAMLERYKTAFWNEYCRYCGKCDGHCPNGVAISDVMRYAMYYKYYGRERDSMELYAALGQSLRAHPCAGCEGPCELGCPYGVRVREQLVEAHGLLSFMA